ncbi:MAG: type II toxin-antitoxin system RelE/ParE family toxin [Terriglobales bacterium]
MSYNVSDLKIRKPLQWLGNSRTEVRSWPRTLQREAGRALGHVQDGREPSNWKPMATVGIGVNEIKVDDGESAGRVIYIAKFPEAVYVLHAFEKTTPKTSKHDLEIAKVRLKKLIQDRKNET